MTLYDTALGRSVSGRYSPFRLRFQTLQPAVQQWLRFGVWPPMQTSVTYRGAPILTAWPAASVTVHGEARHWLPLLLKGL